MLAQEKKQSRDGSATTSATVWQKESFDHIVRSPASLNKFREYIRAHDAEGDAGLCLSEELRRDAAATLITAACAPFDKPALRQTLEQLKKETEQAIDIYTPDEVLEQGFDAAAKAKAAGLVQAFRDYLVANQAQIDALQILYSRTFKHRLTEPMLKDLEAKLKQPFGSDPVNTLWRAHEIVNRKSQIGNQPRRFADLVSLVRFALEQQPVLTPFADTVRERFESWLKSKSESGSGTQPSSLIPQPFTAEQLTWLRLIRDFIATSLSIEPEDLELSPFNQRGGLGKAHQLFGDKLAPLLDELNLVLAA